jgi:hypothetical protein
MILITDEAKEVLVVKNEPIQYKDIVYLNGRPIIKFKD